MNRIKILFTTAALLLMTTIACSAESYPVTVIVEKEVDREVPVTVEVIKEVDREVPVTVVVERVVEVPVTVEVEKEIVREVPVVQTVVVREEVPVTVEVVREVVVREEVPGETVVQTVVVSEIKEVPVTVVVEKLVTVQAGSTPSATTGDAPQLQSTPVSTTQTSDKEIQPQVVAGAEHSCLLRRDGSVLCWGLDNYGQSSPPEGERFVQISAGAVHTCALRVDGTPVCWGDDKDGKASPPAQKFTQISAGGGHTCALRTDGAAVCWGNYYYVSNNKAVSKSMKVPEISQRIIQVSSPVSHTCALRVDGTPICWGYDGNGRSNPPEITQSMIQISAGGSHTCALRADGTPICWGYDGNGRSNPPEDEKFVQISAGVAHTCALRADGTPVCWGDNGTRQTSAPRDEKFVQISAGLSHTCALRADDTPVCWGSDINGQSTPPPEAYARVDSSGSSSMPPSLCSGKVLIDRLTPSNPQISAGDRVDINFRVRGSTNNNTDHNVMLVVEIQDSDGVTFYDSNLSDQNQAVSVSGTGNAGGTFSFATNANTPEGVYQVLASVRNANEWDDVCDATWPGRWGDGHPQGVFRIGAPQTRSTGGGGQQGSSSSGGNGNVNPEQVVADLAKEWSRTSIDEVSDAVISLLVGQIPFVGSIASNILSEQIQQNVRWGYSNPNCRNNTACNLTATARSDIDINIPNILNTTVSVVLPFSLTIDAVNKRVTNWNAVLESASVSGI